MFTNVNGEKVQKVHNKIERLFQKEFANLQSLKKSSQFYSTSTLQLFCISFYLLCQKDLLPINDRESHGINIRLEEISLRLFGCAFNRI